MSKVEKHANILAIVKAHVEQYGRGCETFRLQALGHNKAAIQEAIDDKVIEARKGRTGGLYPYGMVPEAVVKSTLKGEAFAILRALIEDAASVDMSTIEDLVNRYDAECERRSEARKGDDE